MSGRPWALIAALATFCAAPETVAFASDADGGDGLHVIVEAEGGVEVKRRGSSGFAVAGVGTSVRRGDLLRLESAARATVACADLSVHELPAGRLSGVPCPDAAPEILVHEGSLLNPTRSDPPEGVPVVISPRRTRVLSPRPRLRWAPMDEVSAFEVAVRGPGVDWSAEVEGATSIVYPEDAPALAPGETYKVIVVAAGRSSEEGSEPGLGFTLLAADEAESVREAADRILALGLPEAAANLLIAHLYAGHGLDAEAIELLEEVSGDAGPPPLLRKLGELYWRAGLVLEAERLYLEAARLSAEAGDLEGQALARQALGTLYREAFGLEGEAERAFGEALELYRTLGDATAIEELEERLADDGS